MTFNYNRKLPWGLIFFTLLLILLALLTNGNRSNNSKEKETQPSEIGESSPTISDESAPSKEQMPSEETPPEELYNGPDVPEKTPVEDDFFSDSAIMGNSLVEGFKIFSGLSSCDYYAATSMTVMGATSDKCIELDNGGRGTPVEALTQNPYSKIYILLGINEIGFDIDTFGELYTEMLDIIIDGQSDCDIYIMGMTPVSYNVSVSSNTFNMDRITRYNERLRSIAAEKHCYYLDIASALSGEDGYLPSSETPDGVHFSPAIYEKWLEYLKTHYV